MLTDFEKMLFVALSLLALGASYAGFSEMYRIVQRGQGSLHSDKLLRRAARALSIYLSQRTTLKTRRLTGLFHWGVVFGFTYYFLINIVDLLIGFLPDFEPALWRWGALYDGYRLLGDVFSVTVLTGVIYFIARRFYLPNKHALRFNGNILLHPKVHDGAISRDSLIVALFILLHVGARFLGESVVVAQQGNDVFMPFASAVAPLWASLNNDALQIMRHLCWWIALGGILVFMPYFPFTKHAHLFMAPMNFLTRPERASLGELEPLDFNDEDIEQFGANRLEDLQKTHIMDGLACIMCNRCQDVCPAYVTGKELSPAALEVNKRFYMKDNWEGLANGHESVWALSDTLLSESALWACTSCGACIDVCPVGNEPMFDILDIRRDAVLMRSDFPNELQGAFNGMERQGNPWQIAEARSGWTQGLEFPVPTVQENPDFEILYWTGCAVSYDPRAQQVARALVKVLRAADVNFAILGDDERCTGDVARRAGNEYLYFELATENVATLQSVAARRIVVTCPHCFHNIGKEYHQFGGNFDVIHHSELIEELIEKGRLPPTVNSGRWSNVTFHDPCYLGRHNDVVDAPRKVLGVSGMPLLEMGRSKKNSFCCGAGGAQIWKEEEPGDKKVSIARYEEAKGTGAEALAVACPFCMRMFEDANRELGEGPEVVDIAEVIADQL